MMLGRHILPPEAKRFHLTKYLTALPTPPDPLPDYSASFPALLNLGVMGNNNLGDCTKAALGHSIQQLSAATGGLIQPMQDAIIEGYCECDGYVRGQKATDNGGTIQGSLEYWRTVGIPTAVKKDPSGKFVVLSRNRIMAHTWLDPQNHDLVRTAYWLFGTLYIGVTLPNSARSQKTIWDDVGDTTVWGGHAVNVTAINSMGPTVCTWGQHRQCTWAFWDRYVDDVRAPLSRDWLNPSNLLAPSGFDVNALQADLNGLPSNAATK